MRVCAGRGVRVAYVGGNGGSGDGSRGGGGFLTACTLSRLHGRQLQRIFERVPERVASRDAAVITAETGGAMEMQWLDTAIGQLSIGPQSSHK
ncbi:unnamed protein product [Taenia asiatica]|uniref:Transcriptional regulator n=1 Tax=Taenia asiatica TaxID=60517 RepID=A0A0R3WDK5_TAEAS|nr:unnamed protein product [Taenia asiatica]